MSKLRGGPVLLALCLGAAGCDDSPTGPKARELSDAEIASVSAQLRSESLRVLRIVPDGFRYNVLACNPQGSVFTELRITSSTTDPQTQASRTLGTATERHLECEWTETGPLSLLANGTIQHQYDVTATRLGLSAHTGTGTMTSTGTVTLESPAGGRRTCPVALTYTLDYATERGTVKGTYCGRTVDETVQL